MHKGNGLHNNASINPKLSEAHKSMQGGASFHWKCAKDLNIICPPSNHICIREILVSVTHDSAEILLFCLSILGLLGRAVAVNQNSRQNST